MSRLTGRLRIRLRPPRNPGSDLTGREHRGTRTPDGVVIDGAVYPLPGQPPRAQGGNWGDMSWARRRR